LISQPLERACPLCSRGDGRLARPTSPPNRPDIKTIQMPTAAAGYAAALYEKLHEADTANVDWIAVDVPPDAPEWEAVQDRLRRAASNG